MSFDRNDPADLLALKNEVNNDPLGLGYNASSGDTNLILSTINEKTSQFTISKPKISAADIRSATTYDAYNGLAIDEQEWLRWVTGSSGFEEENLTVTADLRNQLVESSTFWAAADRTEMQAAMTLIFDVDGSRGEDLFGFGTAISRDDWFAARDS